VLAALLIVAYSRLIDLKRIRYTATASVADLALLVTTALTAVFIGVDYAILIGSSASIVWYLLHASRLKTQEIVVAPEKGVRGRIDADPPSSGIAIYDIEGDLFFGSAPELHAFLDRVKDEAVRRHVKALVLRLKRVRNPDAVALAVIDIFVRDAQKQGDADLPRRSEAGDRAALGRIGVLQRLGEEFIFPEQEKDYSATLNAIRAALNNVEDRAQDDKHSPNYYLV